MYDLSGLDVKQMVILAEVTKLAYLVARGTVCGIPFEVEKSIADVKFDSDLHVSAQRIDAKYGGNLSKVLDDLFDEIGDIVPDSADPSPALAWWDLLRSQFRRRYEFRFGELRVSVVSRPSDYDVENCRGGPMLIRVVHVQCSSRRKRSPAFASPVLRIRS
jgi:hypothetical protein